MSYCAFLAELLMAECDDRARRGSERWIRPLGFPREKTLGTFDVPRSSTGSPSRQHHRGRHGLLPPRPPQRSKGWADVRLTGAGDVAVMPSAARSGNL